MINRASCLAPFAEKKKYKGTLGSCGYLSLCFKQDIGKRQPHFHFISFNKKKNGVMFIWCKLGLIRRHNILAFIDSFPNE